MEGTLSYSMYIDYVNNYLVSAFRGSTGTWQLFWEVANGTDSYFTLYEIPNATVTDYFYQHYLDDLRSDFLTHFQTYRSQYPNYEIVFTGHSLGAAFATLAAVDMILGGWAPASESILYNYGSPRVGNLAFANKVVELLPNTLWRVVHNKDLVPHVPLCESKFTTTNICENGENSVNYNQTGKIIWYAWHVWQNVWYNQNFTNMTYCVGGEDPKCADSVPPQDWDISDHLDYLGVHVGCPSSNSSKMAPVFRSKDELNSLPNIWSRKNIVLE